MAAGRPGYDSLITIYEQMLPFPDSRQIIDFFWYLKTEVWPLGGKGLYV